MTPWTTGRTCLAGKHGPAMTTTPPARPAAQSSRPGRLRPAAWDVARSEWIKLCTVRSTCWTLLLTAAGMAGSGALLCAACARHYGTVSAAARRGFDPAAYSLSRFFPAQLAIGVLGVVIVTSEYVVREPMAARPEGGSDRRGPPRTLCM